MTIEIRTVREDELAAYLDTMTSAFLERPPDPARIADGLREIWDLARAWAAFDEGRPCGTFRSWATELTVPGGDQVTAAAVSGVTVLPTHRRRGILRRMAAAEHRAARERGDVVAILYASEYPIYGRFGYGMGVRQATWSLDTAGTAYHAPPAGGEIRLVPPDAASRDVIKGIFEGWRRRQVGEIRRRDVSWDFELGIRPELWGEAWRGFLVLHRGPDGEPDGYARYSARSNWERRQPRDAVTVDELHALTPDAYAALWGYLAAIDWVATVRAERRSPSERLPWLLTNARAAAMDDNGDGLWVRLLDIPRALEARTYAGEGSIVLEIVDQEVGGGRTRVLLDASRDGARCTATDRFADLTLDVGAVGAAYLGGTRLGDAVLSTGADEHRAAALTEAERLLRLPDEPWCSTFF